MNKLLEICWRVCCIGRRDIISANWKSRAVWSGFSLYKIRKAYPLFGYDGSPHHESAEKGYAINMISCDEKDGLKRFRRIAGSRV